MAGRFNRAYGEIFPIPNYRLDKEAKVPGKAGVGYETIASLKGVVQLDRFDKDHALLLVQTPGGLNLETIDLP